MSYNYINKTSKPKDGNIMSNKHNRQPVKSLLITSAICAAAAAITRTVLTFTSLDTKYGLYASENPVPVIFHILLAITCLALALTAALKAPELPSDHRIPTDTFTVFTAFVTAFLLTARVLTLLTNATVGGYGLNSFDLFEIIFAALSIIYMVGIALKSSKQSGILALSSFAPIGWCAVCLVSIYFDTEVLMTSPNKIIGLMSFLAAMIYFLCEARIHTEKVSHRFYLAAAAAAPILLFVSSVPNLICRETLYKGPSDDFMHYAIEAGLGLFIYARFVSYTRAQKVTNGESPDSNI